MTMSADDAPLPSEPPKKATAPKKEGPKMASISSTVEESLKAKLAQRAEEEERTEAVLVRRAVKSYMKDWQPGQDD